MHVVLLGAREKHLSTNTLKHPPMEKEEFLANLQKQQLPQTVSALKKFIEFI